MLKDKEYNVERPLKEIPNDRLSKLYFSVRALHDKHRAENYFVACKSLWCLLKDIRDEREKRALNRLASSF
jgi:hypothetical protein